MSSRIFKCCRINRCSTMTTLDLNFDSSMDRQFDKADYRLDFIIDGVQYAHNSPSNFHSEIFIRSQFIFTSKILPESVKFFL